MMYEYDYSPVNMQASLDIPDNQWEVRKYEYLPIGPKTWRRIQAQYQFDEMYTQFIILAEVDGCVTITVIPLANDYSSEIDTHLTQVDAGDDWEATYERVKREILEDTFWEDR